jgi:hypothetical protein
MDNSGFADGLGALRAKARTWGLRFYLGAFVSLGFLFVARAVRHTETLRLIAKAVAGGVGAVAIVMGILSYSYHVRYRRASRRAGINPRTRRRP